MPTYKYDINSYEFDQKNKRVPSWYYNINKTFKA